MIGRPELAPDMSELFCGCAQRNREGQVAGSIGRVMTADDHVLARDLAEEAGRLLLELRARGGDPDVLRKAGARSSHAFLVAELNAQRPPEPGLPAEGNDPQARLNPDRVG